MLGMTKKNPPSVKIEKELSKKSQNIYVPMLIPHLLSKISCDNLTIILDFLGPHKIQADGQIVCRIDPKSATVLTILDLLSKNNCKTIKYVVSENSPIYSFTPQYEYVMISQTVVTLSYMSYKQNTSGVFKLSKKEISLYHVQNRRTKMRPSKPKEILRRIRSNSIPCDDHLIVYQFSKMLDVPKHRQLYQELSRQQFISE